MTSTNRDRSFRAHNRMAATIVAGSLLVAIGFAVFYQYGWLEYLVPSAGPAIDDVPLLFALILGVVALTLWGWRRFISFFE